MRHPNGKVSRRDIEVSHPSGSVFPHHNKVSQHTSEVFYEKIPRSHPTTPTKWTYKAIYRIADHQVGQWSPAVIVIVGG